MSTSNTFGNKMTNICNEVRELSGTSSAMGLDAIASNLSNANDEISEQVSLLTQAIEALDGKAAGSRGEDVTFETNAYTNQLLSLGIAIENLENELQNKASGGSGSGGSNTTEDWILLSSLPVTYANPLGPTEPGTTATTYYLEVPSDTRFVLFNVEMANKTAAILMCYWQRKTTISSGNTIISEVFATAGQISNLTVTEVSSDTSSKILQIDDAGSQASWVYILPIYAPRY